MVAPVQADEVLAEQAVLDQDLRRVVEGADRQVHPPRLAVRLRQAMDKAGEKNELPTIKGGGHGDFTPAQNQQAYLAVRDFLRQPGIVAPAK